MPSEHPTAHTALRLPWRAQILDTPVSLEPHLRVFGPPFFDTVDGFSAIGIYALWQHFVGAAQGKESKDDA